MIRVILDGKLLKEIPKGLNDLRPSIKTDRALKLRYISEDATLIFYADGLQYFQNLDSRGFCGEVKIQIEEDQDDQEWRLLHDGIIHLPACEFGIEPNYVKCPVDDNSFFARINKNKSLKTLLTNDRSKNDLPINQAAHEIVAFFRPSTGAYSPANRWIFPIYDCFRFIIEWMSDKEVGFISDSFGPGGIYSDAGIMSGRELRTGHVDSHHTQPEIDFAKFLTEINKKYNIMIGPETDASGKPMLRIEANQYYYNKAKVSARLNFCHDIKQKIDASRLYASVKAGSQQTDDSSGAVQYPETTRWQTWREEQFPLLGQCNIDTELDLISEYIIDSNIIEQIFVNNIADYDGNILIIEYDRNTLQAKQSNWLSGTPPFFYNEGLKNDAVVARHLSGIPSSIANFLSSTSDQRFLAHQNSDVHDIIFLNGQGSQNTSFLAKNDFTAPGFDNGLNYGDVTVQGILIPNQSRAKYKAPQGGFFRFSSFFHATIHSHSFGSTATFKCTFTRKNAGGATVSAQSFTFIVPPGIVSDFDFQRLAQAAFFMNETDTMRVDWICTFNNLNNPNIKIDYHILKDSFFNCIYTSFGGGVWATVDDSDFDGYIYNFNHSLSAEEFDLIKADLSAAIEFNTDGVSNYKAWIEQMTFYRDRGTADFTLVSTHRLKP